MGAEQATTTKLEPISVGSCPTCGGMCQFVGKEGEAIEHRHLDVSSAAFQDDIAEILRALGLGDHARPYSAHEVVQREILPFIRSASSTTEPVPPTAETRKWEEGFYSGILASLAVVATMEGAGSTLYNEIVKGVNLRRLASAAREEPFDLEHLRKAGFVNARGYVPRSTTTPESE